VTPQCNFISGHLFSRDGLTNWTVSPTEPYSYNLTYSDGSTGLVATRERPKLLFDAQGDPSHIYTSTVDMPETMCAQCNPGGNTARACIDCKVTPPFDKGVYTMVRPLRRASTLPSSQHDIVQKP
jgi:hypothetical protein